VTSISTGAVELGHLVAGFGGSPWIERGDFRFAGDFRRARERPSRISLAHEPKTMAQAMRYLTASGLTARAANEPSSRSEGSTAVRWGETALARFRRPSRSRPDPEASRAPRPSRRGCTQITRPVEELDHSRPFVRTTTRARAGARFVGVDQQLRDGPLRGGSFDVGRPFRARTAGNAPSLDTALEPVDTILYDHAISASRANSALGTSFVSPGLLYRNAAGQVHRRRTRHQRHRVVGQHQPAGLIPNLRQLHTSHARLPPGREPLFHSLPTPGRSGYRPAGRGWYRQAPGTASFFSRNRSSAHRSDSIRSSQPLPPPLAPKFVPFPTSTGSLPMAHFGQFRLRWWLIGGTAYAAKSEVCLHLSNFRPRPAIVLRCTPRPMSGPKALPIFFGLRPTGKTRCRPTLTTHPDRL